MIALGLVGYFVRAYHTGDAAKLKLRPDMAEQFAKSGGFVPFGPKWTMCTREGRPVAVGGLEPSGAATSLGWFLTQDLSRREWWAASSAARDAIAWARSRAIRRIHALTPGDRPEAAAMLARLGFKLTGQEGDDAVMTLELK